MSDVIPDSALASDAGVGAADDIIPKSAFGSSLTTSQPKLDNSWMGALKGDVDIAATMASHAIVDPLAAAARTVNRIVPESVGGPGSRAAVARDISDVQNRFTYSPQTEEGKYGLEQVGKVVSPIVNAASNLTSKVVGKENLPAVSDAFTALPVLGATKAIDAFKGGPPAEEALRSLNAERDAALIAGQREGYVVPPATTNPTLVNRGIEGVAGKINVQQAASIKNQQITNSLARRALDLPPDTPLTPDTLDALRTQAGKTYAAVKGSGVIQVSPDYEKELSRITSSADKINADLPQYRSGASQQIMDLVGSLKPPAGTMNAETAVELSKDLRYNANANASAAARTGDPSLRALSRAQSQAAEVVENEIERHLRTQGQPDLAGQWDNARRTIAKTYSVESALDGAGNVDAAKLAKQSLKGKPLSPELQTAADFANAFPKATRIGASKESMPGISPLDVFAGAGIGESAHAAGASPGAAITTGIAVPAARVAARSLATSSVGQRMAVPSYLRNLREIAEKGGQ